MRHKLFSHFWGLFFGYLIILFTFPIINEPGGCWTLKWSQNIFSFRLEMKQKSALIGGEALSKNLVVLRVRQRSIKVGVGLGEREEKRPSGAQICPLIPVLGPL